MSRWIAVFKATPGRLKLAHKKGPRLVIHSFENRAERLAYYSCKQNNKCFRVVERVIRCVNEQAYHVLVSEFTNQESELVQTRAGKILSDVGCMCQGDSEEIWAVEEV